MIRLGKDVAAANENVGKLADWDCGGALGEAWISFDPPGHHRPTGAGR